MPGLKYPALFVFGDAATPSMHDVLHVQPALIGIALTKTLAVWANDGTPETMSKLTARTVFIFKFYLKTTVESPEKDRPQTEEASGEATRRQKVLLTSSQRTGAVWVAGCQPRSHVPRAQRRFFPIVLRAQKHEFVEGGSDQ